MSAATASVQILPPRVRVRWKIFLLLAAFGLVGFLQRNNVPVAGYRMMPDLSLSQMQLGWMVTAFIAGYTIMQFPGGLLGQRFGARITMVAISAGRRTCDSGDAASAAAGSQGAALFAVLVGAQFVLGLAQGPIFPVSTGVFEAWFRH